MACSTIPFEQEFLATHPETGAPLQNPDGSFITLKGRKSQKTMLAEADNQLIRMVNDQESPAGGMPGACNEIIKPESTDKLLWSDYYEAIRACGESTNRGGGMDFRSLYAARGEPFSTAGRMFLEKHKTVRHSNEMKFKWAEFGANAFFRSAELAIQADNGFIGSASPGSTIIQGDVITSQHGSNSEHVSTGNSEGAGGSVSPTGENDNFRTNSFTVFGNNATAYVTDTGKSTLTADGPTQFNEQSATGLTTENSDLKGVDVIDSQTLNAPKTFNDGKDGVLGEGFNFDI